MGNIYEAKQERARAFSCFWFSAVKLPSLEDFFIVFLLLFVYAQITTDR